MFNRELCTRVMQVAGSVMLCSYAVASQADPLSLQGVCHLSSLVGQGRCDLEYALTDDFASPTPSSARKAQIKVDNILVSQYVNDIANPVPFSFSLVSGSVQVSCGQAHAISALVAEVGDGTPYVKKGSLPSVVCPALP